ncbi:hypothetical protein [Nitrincola sp. A-D6]|uniref:hypothetical protein n=1 Tax=Nitrincola sp. A-D6 TaxID=1545442 RepID=UPI00068FC452|nr:hypothetical protein [Nitrincola sp. A-D6]
MLSFLQGFSIGLFIMCGPWLLTGLLNPMLVLPGGRADRIRVIKRYAFALPFLCLLLGLTSLWGGFGPSLAGWLSGLGILFVWIPGERGLRGYIDRFKQRRHEKRVKAEQKVWQQERATNSLDLDDAAALADPLVAKLQVIKRRLKQVQADISQPDRFYTRYIKLQTILEQRFQPGELAMQRAQALIQDVYLSVIRRLERQADLQQQCLALDPEFIRRKLDNQTTPQAERDALQARWNIVNSINQQQAQLQADNEKTLTILDTTSMALMQLQTQDSGITEADKVMQALELFNQRVSRYEHTPNSRKSS